MAPPPGTRGAPALSAGDLLAARYRLVRPIAATGSAGPRSAQLWLASDEVLARPVAAKVLPATGPGAAALTTPFLDAATAAGAVSSPVLARVYDAAVEQRAGEDGAPPVDVAYVISEWVDGTPLPEQLERDGPYDPAEAVALTTALAEALTSAHACGLTHGRLHPGNVLLARSGAVRLTDLAVAAALPDGRVAADRADDPGPAEADVRDLAALLYALLTGRWPAAATPQPSGGVPGAPSLREGDDGRGKLVSPRQVRAGVPRSLDVVVARALDPPSARQAPALTTPAALSDACEAAVRTDGRADGRSRASAVRQRPARRTGGLPGGLRRRLPLLALLGLLTAIGIASFSVGHTVGTVVTPPDQAAALASPAPSTPVTAAVPLDLTTASVRDFDPDGDGGERPGSVPNAHDGDLSTAWETERYDSADLGGLKDGVGLLVDLGSPTAVTRAELVLSAGGVSAELRAAGQAAPSADGYRVLSRASADGDRLVLVPPEGTRERYYLVWLTGLAPDEDRFTAGIVELAFTG